MERLKDFVATHFVAPAMERRRGLSSSRFLSDVGRIQQGSIDEIQTHQLQRLRVVLAAANKLPLYAERIDAAGISSIANLDRGSWERLRPIDREDIRRLGCDLVGSGCIDDSAVKSATGGTTAAPVTFYLDREAAEHRRAATRYFDAELGYQPGRKIAYLWGAVQDIPEYGRLKGYLINEWVGRRLFLPSNHLRDEEMFEYYRRLLRFKPCLLQAYATPLVLFSRFILAKKLKIRVPAITSTAEVLSDEDFEVVRDAFGVAPVRWYGARDAGRIATECTAVDGLHINCYGLYVESSRDAQVGRILITDLWNTLMPIIRYDIGDIAELDESPCSCGNKAPRLKRLEGRVADILIGSDGRLVPGVTMPGRIVNKSDEICAMQIVQNEKGKFTIRIVPGADYVSQDSDQKLVQQFNRLMESKNQVVIEQVLEIPMEASGKVRFSINEMPPEELRRYI